MPYIPAHLKIIIILTPTPPPVATQQVRVMADLCVRILRRQGEVKSCPRSPASSSASALE